jgi:protein-S-isoprenylcysteine O-methyltransferase Ste14
MMTMTRSLFLLFGVLAYLLFFATFLYLVGFVADAPFLPRTVDHPMGAGWPMAMAIDAGLILLFGLQHSGMARAGFKAMWTRIVPEAVERSVYVVFSSLVLILLFACWQPMPGMVWNLGLATPAALVAWALFGCGWLIVLLSTFMISHFELFGLTQVWNHLRANPPKAQAFYQPLFYRVVRHPLYSGFFIAFWATPRMSHGHLLLAVGMSIYMLIAIEYEERDLVRAFGADYEGYKARMGKLTPRLRRAG